MTDEKGPDAKIISVACGDRCGRASGTSTGRPHLTFEIAHFFEVYKDLEPDKPTTVGGFDGVEAAWRGKRPVPRYAPQVPADQVAVVLAPSRRFAGRLEVSDAPRMTDAACWMRPPEA